MLPERWKLMPLEDIALVERGKFSIRPRNDPRYFGGSIPFVQTGDIGSAGTYLTNFSQNLNEKGLKVSKLFPKNTVLITIAANIGDTAITTFDVACPDSIVAIQPYHEKANCFWLKSILETYKKNLDSKATQNAQKNINLQVLKPLLIKTPPLSEQIKIAKILSTWDKAIKTTEQLLNNSQQQKKALMQQLLNNKKISPRYEEEWNKVQLFTLMMGKKTKGKIVQTNENFEGMPYIGADSFQGYFRLYTNAKDAVLCKSSDILILWDGENAGKVTTGLTGAVSSTVVRISLNTTKANNRFINYCLLKDNYKIRKIREGSGIPHMPGDFERWYEINLPPLSLQEKIASILYTADIEIEILQQKLIKLKQEKKALMQQLLTGKRRVQIEGKRNAYV